MPPENMPGGRKATGSKALKNNPTQNGCETPFRPYMKACNYGEKTVYFIRPDCKSWSCKPCATRRAAVWRNYAHFGGDTLLAQGLELSFVTVTSHRLVRSVTAGVAVWRKAWPRLSARMRRQTPGMQYLYVGERGRVGHFHVHLITSATLKTRWYKDTCASVGLGHQAKAVPIVDGLECAGYVTKYLIKAIAIHDWPKYWRRVNTSRNWPKPEDPTTCYEWSNLGNDILRVKFSMRMYARHGWKIETSLEELDSR